MVIDSTVPNYEQLLQEKVAGVIAVILKPHEDPIAQIAASLQEHPQVTQVHLVCHGRSGALVFSNLTLDSATLIPYASVLQHWGQSLKAAEQGSPLESGLSPSIILYGCEVAQSITGESFVHLLSQIAGVSVVASSTRTGDAEQGGNWKLEYQTESLRVAPVFSQEVQRAYAGVLAAPVNILSFQLGSDINGETVGDLSGSSVSLSADGSVVAIGAHNNDDNGGNSVRKR